MINKAINRFFSRYSDSALIFLRLGVGFIFIMHGIGKLFAVGPFAMGIASTAGFFDSIGIPASLFFAWVVALVETFGGLFVLLGLFTRFSALILVINMIVALAVAHIPNGLFASNGELALLLLLGSLTLLFAGPGNKLKIND